jgi:hypothetical protein
MHFRILTLFVLLQTTVLAATPDSFQQQVTDGTVSLTANFTRFSNRSTNFQVMQQQANGSLLPFTAPSVNTYIGTLSGRPGAMATAVRFADDSVFYRVTFEDGSEWVNEGGLTEVLCATDDFGQCRALTATSFPGFVVGAGGAGSSVYGVEVGIDLPFHRFSEIHNSNMANALSMIEYSIMSTNSLYMREAGIQHQLGLVVIRASQAADPYAPLRGQPTAACAGSVLPQHCDMLNELENQWNNVLNSTTHDMALVVNETGGAGLAAVGVVANPKGYSSNDASTAGDFSRVFRHEGGHNWSLNHFDGGAPEGSTINSGNSLGRMSGPEQKLVVDFRNRQIQSFDNLGALSVAIPPQAATDSVYASNTQGTLIDVLANDHDANGQSLTLVSFNGSSALTLGGSLSLATGQGSNGRDALQYSPPNVSSLSAAIDRFTYRIRDASGLESVGYIFVRLGDLGPAYSQNFNSFSDGTRDLGDGSIMTDVWESTNPVVQVQQQALRLTPDLLSQFGAFTVPKLNLNNGFQASFRFKMQAADTPADGLVINYGDPVPGGSVPGLGGFASGLAVEFDTFSRQGYVVRVDNTELVGGFVPNSNFVDNTWHDVSVRWQGNLLTLVVDGATIFDQLPTPGLMAAADDMVAFSAKTVGLSEEVLIDDVSVAALSTNSNNSAPQLTLASSLMVVDTNSLAGELVNLSGLASDLDGNLTTVQWLVGGQVVATGTAAAIQLPDGNTTVTFTAIDSLGLSATASIVVTVQAPAMTSGWPGPFSGTAPSPALNLLANNIGVYSASDGMIYTCLSIFSNGSPSSLGVVQEFDVAFTLVDAVQGIIQVVNTRPFNPSMALASDGNPPECSGMYETTSGEYNDTIEVGETTFLLRFLISNGDLLQLQLVDAQVLQ